MRLKQLLATILLTMATTAMATASDSQLAGVLVNSRDNAGVVTILANGTFTHTEYRPTDNLMLVDLAGVSVAKQDTSFHAVSAPGVLSYRVAEFRSPDGAQATRIEVNLMPGASVTVADIQGGVELHVTGGKNVRAAVQKSRAAVSHISGVHVVQGNDGLEIEIAGSAPLTAKTMKLSRPDRLVVDIPNSLLQGRPREIAVPSGGDVKMVRAARFQADPPATRVVLDLASMHDFDVVPSGNKLVVKLHHVDVSSAPAAVAAKAAPAMAAPSSNANQIPAPTATAKAENTAKEPPTHASDMMIVNPTFHSKAAEPSAMETEEKSVEATPSRAELAAAHFTATGPAIARENQPPYAGSASLAAKPAAINAALAAQQQQPAPISSGPTSSCVTGRYTGEPIGLNFKDLDLKDFFRVIQEISGLNVVLDPAVKGSVSIFLNDVPWDQALAIVLTNNGLDCQLQGNVLRIATLQTLKTEAEERRAQQEAQALAVPKQTITRYLSYGHAKDAATIIKKFLSARGDVIADDRSNALIIEDIPSTLPKIDELVRMLDRKTPEVEIEARVVASTRNFARDIGTQLGFGYGSGNNAVGGATVDSPIKVTTPAGAPPPAFIQGTTAGTIPLFSNLPAISPTSGVEFINNTLGFRLDFILTMAETRGLLKILSRPHITTFNNIKALIRQGTRIPVVTQAQLGGPPTVTYVDAFLRLTVTPQITAENTIFLDVDVENTVPDFTRVTGAQLNPTLNTQQATTQVLVTDGGTVVIGGVIQTQNNLAIGQVPVLGSIPLLGNLFKHTSVNTQTQELLFFITPKIIQT